MSRNVAKLLAKLNPKSMPLQFSAARSSRAPALTGIDVAAALGAAGAGSERARLAVDVLCLRWWPARVDGPMRTAGHRLVHHCPDMHKKLKVPMTKYAAGCCERIPVEAPAETHAFRHIAVVVERQLRREAARRLSPEGRERVEQAGVMSTWARAVIHEYRHPNHCPVCKHFGKPGDVPKPVEEGGRIVRFDWILCDHCSGAGVMPWGKYRRAKALRMRESTYRDFGMNEAHESALAVLRAMESRGALAVLATLG